MTTINIKLRTQRSFTWRKISRMANNFPLSCPTNLSSCLTVSVAAFLNEFREGYGKLTSNKTHINIAMTLLENGM